jgi:hypothetical protein
MYVAFFSLLRDSQIKPVTVPAAAAATAAAAAAAAAVGIVQAPPARHLFILHLCPHRFIFLFFFLFFFV